MVRALKVSTEYNFASFEFWDGWDLFDPSEPCSTVAQPIRQEEGLQKAQSSEEYTRAYRNVRL